MEKQKIDERNALNDKLKTAANLRDENIKRILERLREHVSLLSSYHDVVVLFVVLSASMSHSSWCCLSFKLSPPLHLTYIICLTYIF
jgi:hypothetical protein